MILSKCKLDEAQELSFDLAIFGTSEQAEQVRFVIEGKDYDISIPCTRNGEDLKVTIPKLKGIVESGSYDVRMEVILDGRIFTPLKESIEFEQLVEFGVKKTKSEPIKEGVRVTMKTNPVSEDTKNKQGTTQLEESLRKVMEEGFDVTKVNDVFTIKEGENYIGVIDKSGNIKKSDKSFTTFSEMSKALN